MLAVLLNLIRKVENTISTQVLNVSKFTFRLEVIVPKGWMIGVKGVWNNLTNGLMFAVIGAPRNSNSQEKHELERKENNF